MILLGMPGQVDDTFIAKRTVKRHLPPFVHPRTVHPRHKQEIERSKVATEGGNELKMQKRKEKKCTYSGNNTWYIFFAS